ncbi:amidase [Candidatus Bathyarchaeota archaeon]|nr:amidase [Candidatus Bathyarchaeota archaeon]
MTRGPAHAFTVTEATISETHEAIQSGRLTCSGLVEAYLKRIEAYDQPTSLNSLVVVNPDAVRRAQELDEEYRRTGRLRPLHGVPVIVKDNYDTRGLQTAAGSLAMKGSLPPDDSYQVRRLREEGAIVLAKSNMAEWAFSPYQTVSSIAGTTRNPYDLKRVPAGSSGGTAAAVAANLGLVGLGTDTGNSIRGPASHCCLVGIRSTMGLTSRDGIVPLYLRNDMGGPLCRAVEDAARVLDAISGYDAADPVTKHGDGKKPRSYTDSLDVDALEGKRVGVFWYYTDQPTTDPEVLRVFEKALDDLDNNGAELVDPVNVPGFDELTENIWCRTFRRDLEAYLATLTDPPHRTLKSIVDSGLYSDYIADRLKGMLEAPEPRCGDLYTEPKNIRLREAVVAAMDEAGVDALVYPTWSNPPRLIGDMESPAGDNSQKIPPHTGLPGLTVPMGFTRGGLPAGLQIVGRLFSEPTLIGMAYAYEQATRHRRPPTLFPGL